MDDRRGSTDSSWAASLRRAGETAKLRHRIRLRTGGLPGKMRSRVERVGEPGAGTAGVAGSGKVRGQSKRTGSCSAGSRAGKGSCLTYGPFGALQEPDRAEAAPRWWAGNYVRHYRLAACGKLSIPLGVARDRDPTPRPVRPLSNPNQTGTASEALAEWT